MSDNCGNNEDLSKISAAFTESLLLQILKESSGKEDAELVGYKFAGGSAKGDGYLSVVNRLILEGTAADGAHISSAIIVKSLPTNLGRRKTFRSDEFFSNEAAFYNEVLPRLNAFQEKKNLQCPFNEIPRCFKALADGKNDIIVLEDLSAQGFKLANRLEALDLEHCKIVLRSLARFHALSFAMKDQEPEEFKNAADAIKETYYKEDAREWYKDMLQLISNISNFAVSKHFPKSKYTKKMKEFTEGPIYDKVIGLANSAGPYSIILHGDPWINNVMFKYNELKIQDMYLIDFQMTRFASPALDLSFFFYSSINPNVRHLHYDNLLTYYYENLSEFVNTLGSDLSHIFPYNTFLEEMKQKSAFGFIMSMENVPYAVVDESEQPDINNIDGDEAVTLTTVLETYFSEETREWYKGITNIVYKLAEDAVSIEFPNSVYERKTKELLGNDVFSKILQLVKVKEPSSVLLNGDVWVNNLLFKYEDSKIAGVNLIDFQLSRYASPVLDFSVFIYTCTTQEQRNTHYEEFLNLYYKTLSEFVTDLGSDLSKVYPYNNFLKEVKEMSAYGLIVSIECIPYATIDENQTPDIESIEGDEAISLEKAMYLPPMTNKKKRLRLASVLVDAIDKGYI